MNMCWIIITYIFNAVKSVINLRSVIKGPVLRPVAPTIGDV